MSKAVLVDLMSIANEGEPYGYLADEHGPLTDDYMASRGSRSVVVFRKSVVELIRYTRLGFEDGKGYFIPRMVRDEAIRMKRAVGGGMSIGHPKTHPPKNREGGIEGYPSCHPSTHPLIVNKGDPLSRAIARADSDSVFSSSSLNTSIENQSCVKEPNLPKWSLDEEFQQFAKLARKFWLDLIDEDLSGWYWAWTQLDFDQRQQVNSAVQQRIDMNIDFSKVFRPTFFSKSEWKRKLIPPRSPMQNNRKDNGAEAIGAMLRKDLGLPPL